MIILLGYAMVFLRREITATSSFLWVFQFLYPLPTSCPSRAQYNYPLCSISTAHIWRVSSAVRIHINSATQPSMKNRRNVAGANFLSSNYKLQYDWSGCCEWTALQLTGGPSADFLEFLIRISWRLHYDKRWLFLGQIYSHCT